MQEARVIGRSGSAAPPWKGIADGSNAGQAVRYAKITRRHVADDRGAGLAVAGHSSEPISV